MAGESARERRRADSAAASCGIRVSCVKGIRTWRSLLLSRLLEQADTDCTGEDGDGPQIEACAARFRRRPQYFTIYMIRAAAPSFETFLFTRPELAGA